MIDDIIKFTREKSFNFIKELGNGSCGKTVLLYDETIKEQFVCKKFSPDERITDKEMREDLFQKFIQEIKLLHLANHPNVVRVFNYYIYSQLKAGYIVMEYVEGAATFDDYLSLYPENIDDIFLQCLQGFEYLSKINILHRDIRPANVMINQSGMVKIIDFGFSKPISEGADFGKSITLNWHGSHPKEFMQQIYDFRTEIYFVGKLFQKIIIENKIEHFSYTSILNKMCMHDPNQRYQNFSSVISDTVSETQPDIFTDTEIEVYREFSSELYSCYGGIEEGSKYVTAVEKIEASLEELHKGVMLEQWVPSLPKVTRCFVVGNHKYKANAEFSVHTLRSFLNLLKFSSIDKKNIIIRNIHSKLDAVSRYSPKPVSDIPF